MIASAGGKPKPKVEMVFRTTESGRILQAVRENDYVEFFIALSPDHILPIMEYLQKNAPSAIGRISMHPTPGKSRLCKEGERNRCPVDGMNYVIDRSGNVNDQIYFSKFRAFRFGNQSTVFVHCQVQVCLNKDECSKPCYKKVSDSNLTAERLRFCHKRRITDLTRRTTRSTPTDDYDLEITNSLTVHSNTESVELTSIPVSEPVRSIANVPSEQRREFCPRISSFGFVPHFIMGALASLLIFSTVAAIYFGCKLKNIKKKYSFNKLSAISNSAVSL